MPITSGSIPVSRGGCPEGSFGTLISSSPEVSLKPNPELVNFSKEILELAGFSSCFDVPITSPLSFK